MKIYIQNEIIEYENNKEEIDKIFKVIDETVTSTSKILSHLIIDDLDVYSNYYEYFVDNIKVIEKVQVILQTYEELVNETLQSTWEYTNKVPEKIEELANKFYRNPDKQSWDDLNDFLGGISWIINTFSTIDQDVRLKDTVASYTSWNIYAGKINSLGQILPDFEGALTSNDNVSIADILSYEMLPILNKILESLVQLLDMEGLADGLN